MMLQFLDILVVQTWSRQLLSSYEEQAPVALGREAGLASPQSGSPAAASLWETDGWVTGSGRITTAPGTEGL